MQYIDLVIKINEITDAMLAQSKEAEWADVAVLEESRQVFLTQLGGIELRHADMKAQKLLNRIIENNNAIERLSRQEMEDCRQNYRETKKKKNAINAYYTV